MAELTFRATPKGTVFIERGGERVKTLRADRARRFLALAHSTDRVGQQALMARMTSDEQGSKRGK
jgi:hypothetical protein